MRTIQAVIGIMLLLPAAFCVFGFLASGESVAHATEWRLGYAAADGKTASVGLKIEVYKK